jgi:hypothetical protein
LRRVSILHEIADKRMDMLARYQAGELPPQIVLGCYYGVGQGKGASCRAGSRRNVISAIRFEAEGYRVLAANTLSDHSWSCRRPFKSGIEDERSPSTFQYLRQLSDYVLCAKLRYESVATAASPSELAQFATDRDEAVEELEEEKAALADTPRRASRR